MFQLRESALLDKLFQESRVIVVNVCVGIQNIIPCVSLIRPRFNYRAMFLSTVLVISQILLLDGFDIGQILQTYLTHLRRCYLSQYN